MRREGLARSGIVGLIGSAFSALAALILTALVARGLGAHGTGLFFQIIGLFTVATQILNLGTSSGIIRFTSANHALGRPAETARLMAVALVPVGLLGLVVTAAARWSPRTLASWFAAPDEIDQLAVLIREMAPYVVVMAVLGVLQTAIRMTRGLLAFSVLQDILLPVGRLLLVGIAVIAGWSLAGTAEAWAAALPFWLIVTAGLLIRPLRREQPGDRSSRTSMADTVRQFWGYSWARAVGGALEVGLAWSDVLIVAALRSPAEAGVYAVATRAVRAGQVVDRAMRLAVSPTIAGLLAKGDVPGAIRLHTLVSRAMILSTWPFYLTLATLGPSVMLLFGDGFDDRSFVLIILSVVMMFAAAAGMLQSVLLMGGRSSWQMGNKALALAISIAGNLMLVPTLGITGAAIVWAAVVAVDTSIAAYLVHRRMAVRLEPRKLIGSALIPLAVFGGGGLAARLFFGTSISGLVLFLAVAGTVYVAAMWAWRERLGMVGVWRQLPAPLRRALRIDRVPSR